MNQPNIQWSPGALLAPGIDWLNVNLHPLFAAISAFIETILGVVERMLLSVPSYALIAIAAGLAFAFIGRRAAILATYTLGFCLLSGLWEQSMKTVSLVSVESCRC